MKVTLQDKGATYEPGTASTTTKVIYSPAWETIGTEEEYGERQLGRKDIKEVKPAVNRLLLQVIGAMVVFGGGAIAVGRSEAV
jgi:hypothetical protein